MLTSTIFQSVVDVQSKLDDCIIIERTSARSSWPAPGKNISISRL